MKEKCLYKIGEVSELTGIAASTLRFWESELSVLNPLRTGRGVRRYRAEDIERIRMLDYLIREKGMKLKAAEAEVLRNPSGMARRMETLDRLRGVRERLVEMLEALDAMRRTK